MCCNNLACSIVKLEDTPPPPEGPPARPSAPPQACLDQGWGVPGAGRGRTPPLLAGPGRARPAPPGRFPEAASTPGWQHGTPISAEAAGNARDPRPALPRRGCCRPRQPAKAAHSLQRGRKIQVGRHSPRLRLRLSQWTSPTGSSGRPTWASHAGLQGRTGRKDSTIPVPRVHGRFRLLVLHSISQRHRRCALQLAD